MKKDDLLVAIYALRVIIKQTQSIEKAPRFLINDLRKLQEKYFNEYKETMQKEQDEFIETVKNKDFS